MSNLFNFISNAANKFKDRNSNNLIEALQLNPNGEVDPEKTLELKQHTTPRTLSEHLLGRNMSFDTQKINPATGETQLETISNFQPGFLNNLNAGANENFKNNFEVDNLKPNNKGFGYKIGEALGTFGRGLSGWAGDAYIAGTQGLDAAMNRQNIRMADNLYRKSLENQGIDTAGITGFIVDVPFRNMINAQVIKDNADWKRLYFDRDNENRAVLLEMKKEEAERQKQKEARDYQNQQERNYLTRRGQDLNYDIANKRLQADMAKKALNYEQAYSQLSLIEKQLNRFSSSFKNMPGKLESNTLGRVRDWSGTQTDVEVNFNSQRQLLFNKIARDLGGEKGVLSDQDIKLVEKTLPNYTDSYSQKQAKMKAVYDLLNDRINQLKVKGNTQNVNNDPLGIR